MLRELRAFTRLYGVIRYFHPSDEAAKTDWVEFAVQATEYLLNHQPDTSEQLVELLNAIFLPVAPSLQIVKNEDEGETVQKKELKSRIWKHYGYAEQNGTDKADCNVYSHERVTTDETADPYCFDLGVGYKAIVPVSVYVQEGKTIPCAEMKSSLPALNMPLEDLPLSCSAGIASIVILWNVIQHFYSYFEFIEDWPGSLEEALEHMLKAESENGRIRILKLLMAKTRDGHIHLYQKKSGSSRFVPFTLGMVSDRFYVTGVHPAHSHEIALGTEVITIDGKRLSDQISEISPILSAANETAKKSLFLDYLRFYPKETVKVEIADKHTSAITISTRLFDDEETNDIDMREMHTYRYLPYFEIEPEIWYVDTTRIFSRELLLLLPKLCQAKAIMFDVRGYPRSHFTDILIPHLIDEEVKIPYCIIPKISAPDRTDLEDEDKEFNRWSMLPKEPKIRGKKVFLINAVAISYAEFCLSIVDHYGLGTLVGEQTAGTNGNATDIRLPSNLSMFFTGMKVLHHNGQPHHGRGIMPDVVVEVSDEGLKAGRDEVFIKGFELLKG